MRPAQRLAVLLGCGAIVWALAVVVLVLNRDAATDLLAVLGLVGGVAIVVTALPAANGNGH